MCVLLSFDVLTWKRIPTKTLQELCKWALRRHLFLRTFVNEVSCLGKVGNLWHLAYSNAALIMLEHPGTLVIPSYGG